MKILVLGAGGIGGYFGGRLAESGADVTFLLRPKRREQLIRDGLRIRSEIGDIQFAVKTTAASELQPVYEVVLLTCKAYDLDSAMNDMAPAMTGSCTVLPMLNGMAHFDRLDAQFGREKVLGGTCAISVSLDRDGVIHHNGKLQRMTFGERDHAMSSRTEALASALTKTKVDWELSEDIQRSLWEKLVLLSALAATNCLFRASVAEVVAAGGGREAVERALNANVAIAAKEGYPLSERAIDSARKALTNPAGNFNASMLNDIEKGNQVESDHIVGWMLEKARKHGVDDTILSLAYTHLKAYEARRGAGRLPKV